MAKIFGEIGASALMTFDKTFARSNGQPLDSTEVFYSLSAAETYAAGDVAYVGQKIVVIETVDDVVTATHYGIEPDSSLKELGTSPVGDESTITVAADGTVSLYGVSGLQFIETNAEGEEASVTYQPLLTSAGLTWVKPSATTVEGLSTEIEGLKTRMASLETTIGNEDGGLVKDVADAMTEAEAKVASVSAADASVVVSGDATAPSIAAQISKDADNALELAEDGLKVVIPAAAEYSIVKDESSNDYAAVYHLTKDGENVGAAINIPKDMVVESGSVVENPDGQAEGTYIKLVLQNVAEPLYINVGSLIEYVTSGSAESDMVVIAVSDDHKVTATITDGSITAAKLEASAQAALNKAHEHSNKDVLDGIDADKVAAWDSAEQNAKDYADGMDEAMNARMEAVEAKAHEHANADVLNGVSAEKVAAWDEAAEKASANETALESKVDKVDGSRLMTEEEGTKLAGIADGAQVNVIDGVSKEFTFAEGKILGIAEVDSSKITGLDDLLAGKVDVVEGSRLITEAEGTLLGSLESGAQVNVIESVSLNGTLLEIVEKGVNIPLGAGLKASTEIEIGEDGTLSIGKINMNKVTQDEGESLVLNGGGASV